MGSNFFARVPFTGGYRQAQAQDVQTNAGPYAGQTPTLAAANVGYAPGTTAQGAQGGWMPNQGGLPGLILPASSYVQASKGGS